MSTLALSPNGEKEAYIWFISPLPKVNQSKIGQDVWNHKCSVWPLVKGKNDKPECRYTHSRYIKSYELHSLVSVLN